MNDAEKLARFERFADELRTELASTQERLADLRGQGKTKTATYRQLFANLQTLKQVDGRLRDLGL